MSDNKRFGVMLDCSRNAVMKPEQVKKFVDYISAFGYNCIQLYTEDTFEVDGEPYFGYLRGRYTKDELKNIDAYCAKKGVELIPCVQTLAHVNQIFRWNEYACTVCDTGDILLADEARTYALIENIFKVSDVNNLKVFRASGDSMEDTIYDNDDLLVDIGRKDFNNGGIFVLTINNEWFIKRLQLRINGDLDIISDNKSKYQTETKHPNDDIEIIIKGRVIKNLSRGL